MGVHIDGGMRPLILVPARKLHRSAKLGYDQLALVETLAIGCHAVDHSAVGHPDQPVGGGVSLNLGEIKGIMAYKF